MHSYLSKSTEWNIPDVLTLSQQAEVALLSQIRQTWVEIGTSSQQVELIL